MMETVAVLGPLAMLNIHAENAHIVEWATKRIKQEHPHHLNLSQWAATHPPLCEVDAVRQAVLLAQQTGARIYFVHISAAESVALIKALKLTGQSIYAETTSPYLILTDQSDMGPLAKMVPPFASLRIRPPCGRGSGKTFWILSVPITPHLP